MTSMNRLIGGILLVSGTAIGAGMLAIPVISSFAGFFPSTLLLAGCWLFLFLTSLLLLDVTLVFKGEVNLITMAGKTLGTLGKSVCWITYLLLLYSLNAAYIAGISPLFLEVLSTLIGWQAPQWVGPFPLLIILGTFVYLGTQTVDWVNRLFMFGLIFAYALLTAFLPPHIRPELLERADFPSMWVALPIFITSFGFHIIIPTLTTYLEHDKKALRWSLFIGSLIPLLVYFIWELLILGIVPLQGQYSLVSAWSCGHTAIEPLSYLLQNSWIAILAKAFSFFAILTSFLGVSLSLSDFLTDGFHMKRFSWGRELACLMTFVPPLFFVLAYSRGFLLALQFAGIFVVILLCILPALMTWKLPQYRSLRKKAFLITIIVLSIFAIFLDVLEQIGVLGKSISHYL